MRRGIARSRASLFLSLLLVSAAALGGIGSLSARAATATEDVALQSKGATASASSWGSYSGTDATPGRAIDGDLTTAWGGTQGGGDWLRIELAQQYYLQTIRVNLGYHSVTYDVKVSTDGSTWTTVANDVRTQGDHYVATEAKSSETISVAGTQAKYVKIRVESTNAPLGHIWQVMIEEVKVFPAKDVARLSKGATASASTWGSYSGDDAVPRKAIDGEHGTEWGGTRGGGDWLQVDLGQTYPIKEVIVDLGYHSATYDVKVSTDGASWQTVANDVHATGDAHTDREGQSIRETAANGVEARYVRIAIESTNAPFGHIWQVLIENVVVVPASATETNEPPEAAFQYVPTNPTTRDEAVFDASGATDPDGSIQTYNWDLDGDGFTDATGQTVTHRYSEPGTYTVALTVVDGDGATDTATTTVTVVEANRQPTADFVVQPPRPQAGESVTFESTSQDDGTITAYEWQFGDGTTASGATVTHTFRTPGIYTVELTVVDDDGTTATVTKRVRVGPPSIGRGEPPTNVDGDPRYEDVNGDGRPSIADVKMLFENRNAKAIRNSPTAFDYNGDGEFTVADIQKLYTEIQ